MSSPPLTLQTILELINDIAPFSLAESWDNVGLMIDSPCLEITGIVIGLDPTLGLLDEALERGANLLVTHHPIIFHPLKSIRTDQPEGAFINKAITNNIAVISCHTNLDVVAEGVSVALARKLGMQDLKTLCQSSGADTPLIGFGQTGKLPKPLPSAIFMNKMCQSLSIGAVKIAGQLPNTIDTIAVCGGSGSDLAEAAYATGAQVYITGEIKHNVARWAEEVNFCIIDAGHYSTESMVVDTFASLIHSRLASQGINIPVKGAAKQTDPFDFYIMK